MSGSDSELVLGKIFERAIETKRRVGQIYRQFARLFSHIPEVEDFWRKMNINQVTHADWLKEIKDSLSEEQILSLPQVDLVLKTHAIKNLFENRLQHLNNPVTSTHRILQYAVNRNQRSPDESRLRKHHGQELIVI